MGAPEALPIEAWQRVLDLNLLSIARSNLVFLPLLIEQGRGHVVNTSSASGLLAYGFDRLPYVATKHAVVGISEALALYLAPKGVGVTCVCPSGVVTNILEQITVYGEATSPRAPQHPIVDPGRRSASSSPTRSRPARSSSSPHRRSTTSCSERAADPEAYIQRMIEEQTHDPRRVRRARQPGRADGQPDRRRRLPHHAVGTPPRDARTVRRHVGHARGARRRARRSVRRACASASSTTPASTRSCAAPTARLPTMADGSIVVDPQHRSTLRPASGSRTTSRRCASSTHRSAAAATRRPPESCW